MSNNKNNINQNSQTHTMKIISPIDDIYQDDMRFKLGNLMLHTIKTKQPTQSQQPVNSKTRAKPSNLRDNTFSLDCPVHFSIMVKQDENLLQLYYHKMTVPFWQKTNSSTSNASFSYKAIPSINNSIQQQVNTLTIINQSKSKQLIRNTKPNYTITQSIPLMFMSNQEKQKYPTFNIICKDSNINMFSILSTIKQQYTLSKLDFNYINEQKLKFSKDSQTSSRKNNYNSIHEVNINYIHFAKNKEINIHPKVNEIYITTKPKPTWNEINSVNHLHANSIFAHGFVNSNYIDVNFIPYYRNKILLNWTTNKHISSLQGYSYTPKPSIKIFNNKKLQENNSLNLTIPNTIRKKMFSKDIVISRLTPFTCYNIAKAKIFKDTSLRKESPLRFSKDANRKGFKNTSLRKESPLQFSNTIKQNKANLIVTQNKQLLYKSQQKWNSNNIHPSLNNSFEMIYEIKSFSRKFINKSQPITFYIKPTLKNTSFQLTKLTSLTYVPLIKPEILYLIHLTKRWNKYITTTKINSHTLTYTNKSFNINSLKQDNSSYPSTVNIQNSTTNLLRWKLKAQISSLPSIIYNPSKHTQKYNVQYSSFSINSTSQEKHLSYKIINPFHSFEYKAIPFYIKWIQNSKKVTNINTMSFQYILNKKSFNLAKITIDNNIKDMSKTLTYANKTFNENNIKSKHDYNMTIPKTYCGFNSLKTKMVYTENKTIIYNNKTFDKAKLKPNNQHQDNYISNNRNKIYYKDIIVPIWKEEAIKKEACDISITADEPSISLSRARNTRRTINLLTIESNINGNGANSHINSFSYIQPSHQDKWNNSNIEQGVTAYSVFSKMKKGYFNQKILNIETQNNLFKEIICNHKEFNKNEMSKSFTLSVNYIINKSNKFENNEICHRCSMHIIQGNRKGKFVLEKLNVENEIQMQYKLHYKKFDIKNINLQSEVLFYPSQKKEFKLLKEDKLYKEDNCILHYGSKNYYSNKIRKIWRIEMKINTQNYFEIKPKVNTYDPNAPRLISPIINVKPVKKHTIYKGEVFSIINKHKLNNSHNNNDIVISKTIMLTIAAKNKLNKDPNSHTLDQNIITDKQITSSLNNKSNIKSLNTISSNNEVFSITPSYRRQFIFQEISSNHQALSIIQSRPKHTSIHPNSNSFSIHPITNTKKLKTNPLSISTNQLFSYTTSSKSQNKYIHKWTNISNIIPFSNVSQYTVTRKYTFKCTREHCFCLCHSAYKNPTSFRSSTGDSEVIEDDGEGYHVDENPFIPRASNPAQRSIIMKIKKVHNENVPLGNEDYDEEDILNSVPLIKNSEKKAKYDQLIQSVKYPKNMMTALSEKESKKEDSEVDMKMNISDEDDDDLIENDNEVIISKKDNYNTKEVNKVKSTKNKNINYNDDIIEDNNVRNNNEHNIGSKNPLKILNYKKQDSYDVMRDHNLYSITSVQKES